MINITRNSRIQNFICFRIHEKKCLETFYKHRWMNIKYNLFLFL